MNEIQLGKLKKTVAWCYERVPFYKNGFDKIGLKPEHIKTLKDVKNIPFTNKDDLRDNYPYGMFAVPMRDVVRIHASSGTTGRSTVVGYTKADLEMWSESVARVAVMAGATADDIVQVAFGYSLFTGAFGLHYGLEKLGAAIIPVSSGNSERQIKLMQEFGTTVLVSTPSYALYLAEVAEKLGVDTAKLNLKLGLLGAEGHTEEMRREIERRFQIKVTENYGLSEIVGPGVSGECTLHTGMHINEDYFLHEIIDPDTGEVLPEGEQGEVVITTLQKEALPLLRYRTHDIACLDSAPCACGRTTTRMAKVKGRSDDMLIIRGVNVFPSQIESVILNVEQVAPNYEIVVSRRGYLDEIEVLVEVSDVSLLDSFSKLEALEEEIRSKLKVILGLDAKVRLVEPESLKRFEGKAKRVTDLRK
ncbi:phenylacetate--CoA ligase [Clostridia bacterium OttesenSCG-928-F22]|nr:phenylacetate--CoA ligase [Clostridia bacterium OttesenSCG-928-F22]